MKRLYSYFLIALAGIIFLACEQDNDRLPELTEGATLRLQFPDPDYTLFNFEELDKAKLQFDMFTVNKNIDSANLYITYYSFAQDSTYTERLIRTYEQGDFNAEGAIRNITITPDDVATSFGISKDLITGGDRIDIRTEIVLEDGRRFPTEVPLPERDPATNVHPSILAATTSSFNAGFSAYVACPLPTNFGVGTYEVEQIAGPEDPFAGGDVWLKEEITLSAASPIGRTFEGTYLGFGGIEFNFLLVCENVLVPATSSGLSCGGPAFAWASAPIPGNYSAEADDEIILELIENTQDACGVPGGDPLTLKLTRVE